MSNETNAAPDAAETDAAGDAVSEPNVPSAGQDGADPAGESGLETGEVATAAGDIADENESIAGSDTDAGDPSPGDVDQADQDEGEDDDQAKLMELRIMEVDPVAFGGGVAQLTIIKMISGLQSPLFPDGSVDETAAAWMYEDVSFLDEDPETCTTFIEVAVEKLAQYVAQRAKVTGRAISGEVLHNKAWEFGIVKTRYSEATPFETRLAYDFFSKLVFAAWDAVSKEQIRIKHQLATRENPTRDPIPVSDTIFEKEGSILERDPAFTPRVTVSEVPADAASVEDPENATPLDPPPGATEPVAGQSGVMSIGETLPKPPKNKGGRPSKGGGRRTSTRTKAAAN